MADEDILAAAASTTQAMIPQHGSLTQFGPAPMVQPPPMPRPQVQQQQFGKAGNEFQTVSGRKRADRQALFSNTANLIKTGSDFIQAKKQRALTMDIERLIQAQQGLEEAKSSQDQEGIKKNTAIINDITSDPKKVKQLQKAFNIDLMGGGKNKNENQALMQAWKNTNKDPTALSPVAQRLQASQPWQQQLSPEAQAQAMAIKAGLAPKAGEVLRAYQDNFKALNEAKSSEDRTAALERIAANKNDLEMNKIKALGDSLDKRLANAKDLADIRMRTEKYKAQTVAATWDKRLAMMDKIAKAKTGNGTIFKQMYQEASTYNNHLKELAADTAKLQVEVDKQSQSWVGKAMGFKQADSADVKQMKQKIMMNNIDMQQTQNNLSTVTQKMQTLNQLGVLGTAELGKGDSGGGNESTGDTDQVTVPDDEVPE